jgi:hypothetical protein
VPDRGLSLLDLHVSARPRKLTVLAQRERPDPDGILGEGSDGARFEMLVDGVEVGGDDPGQFGWLAPVQGVLVGVAGQASMDQSMRHEVIEGQLNPPQARTRLGQGRYRSTRQREPGRSAPVHAGRARGSPTAQTPTRRNAPGMNPASLIAIIRFIS